MCEPNQEQNGSTHPYSMYRYTSSRGAKIFTKKEEVLQNDFTQVEDKNTLQKIIKNKLFCS